MDLFGALELGKRSLLTYQSALNVTGQNIANVGTEGFTRRRIDLQPGFSQPVRGGFLGTGVDVARIASVRDSMVERQLRGETARSGFLDSRHGALRGVLAAVDESSSPGVGAALSAMFDAFSALATQPENPALRRTAVEAGNRVAQKLNETWNRLDGQRADLDAQIEILAAGANDLTTRIASLNKQIAIQESGGREASDLRDVRDRAVSELARIVDITAFEDQRGNVQISLASTGDPLVSTDTATALSAVPDPARNGLAAVTLVRAGVAVDLSPRLRGGRLGGLLEARDDVVTASQADLDLLASSIMSEVNTLHRAGFDLSGAAGLDLFTSAAGVGAAAGITLNAGILADPTLLAAAATPSPGDSGTAIAISELRKTRLAGLGSATPATFLGAAVGRVGFETAGTEASLAAQQDLLISLQARRDEVSGVSLDEEAVRLSQYQAAYTAAARFIQTIDELTQVALSLGASR